MSELKSISSKKRKARRLSRSGKRYLVRCNDLFWQVDSVVIFLFKQWT